MNGLGGLYDFLGEIWRATGVGSSKRRDDFSLLRSSRCASGEGGVARRSLYDIQSTSREHVLISSADKSRKSRPKEVGDEKIQEESRKLMLLKRRKPEDVKMWSFRVH